MVPLRPATAVDHSPGPSDVPRLRHLHTQRSQAEEYGTWGGHRETGRCDEICRRSWPPSFVGHQSRDISPASVSAPPVDPEQDSISTGAKPPVDPHSPVASVTSGVSCTPLVGRPP